MSQSAFMMIKGSYLLVDITVDCKTYTLDQTHAIPHLKTFIRKIRIDENGQIEFIFEDLSGKRSLYTTKIEPYGPAYKADDFFIDFSGAFLILQSPQLIARYCSYHVQTVPVEEAFPAHDPVSDS